jgi:S-adenosyl-L-methionine hydrolase (adenosine-forming)
MTPPLVTLTTDFGAGSGYPAQLKGILLSALPELRIVDLSHDVPSFDIAAGALLLEACVPWFPADAVHLAVVDPGVGTGRRPLAVVDPEGRRLVGPDNGLLTPFLGEGARVFLLAEPALVPAPRSATFHGRDLFAPVAAQLARGIAAERLGPEVRDPVRLDLRRVERRGGELWGAVLAADSFGNLLTSIRQEDLDARVREVRVAGRAARWVRTFGEGAAGELLAMVGSGGRVELAVREGSAAARVGAWRGVRVVVGLA